MNSGAGEGRATNRPGISPPPYRGADASRPGARPPTRLARGARPRPLAPLPRLSRRFGRARADPRLPPPGARPCRRRSPPPPSPSPPSTPPPPLTPRPAAAARAAARLLGPRYLAFSTLTGREGVPTLSLLHGSSSPDSRPVSLQKMISTYSRGRRVPELPEEGRRRRRRSRGDGARRRTRGAHAARTHARRTHAHAGRAPPGHAHAANNPAYRKPAGKSLTDGLPLTPETSTRDPVPADRRRSTMAPRPHLPPDRETKGTLRPPRKNPARTPPRLGLPHRSALKPLVPSTRLAPPARTFMPKNPSGVRTLIRGVPLTRGCVATKKISIRGTEEGSGDQENPAPGESHLWTPKAERLGWIAIRNAPTMTTTFRKSLGGQGFNLVPRRDFPASLGGGTLFLNQRTTSVQGLSAGGRQTGEKKKKGPSPFYEN